MTEQLTIKKRNPGVDIAKAIGIALIVLGHVSGSGEGSLLIGIRRFVYQFHVPLFFFLSGYCFKHDESWRTFLLKKIKRLYLPFVVANAVFLLISLLAHRLAGEEIIAKDVARSCLKIVLGRIARPLGGASWFLITLLKSLIIYKLARDIIYRYFTKNRLLYLSILSVILGLIGIKWSFLWSLDKAFLAILFICAGHLAKEKGLLSRFNIQQKVFIAIFGFVIVLVCSLHNYPDMALHSFGSIPLYFIGAFAGIAATIASSDLLANLPSLSFISDWGRRTLWVLLGHFAAFKIVTIIQIVLLGQPESAIFSHPCNYVGGLWAALYFVTGFFVPLYLSVFLNSRQKQ